MALAIPLADLMAYAKLCKAYFNLVDVLCHNHTQTLATRDSAFFSFLILSLDAGLVSLDTSVSSACSAALDSLAGFYFRAINNDGQPSLAAQVELHLPFPNILLAIQHTLLSSCFSFHEIFHSLFVWLIHRKRGGFASCLYCIFLEVLTPIKRQLH